MAVQLQRRLLTVDDYHVLIRAGSLGEDDRVELIEGEIISQFWANVYLNGFDHFVKRDLK